MSEVLKIKSLPTGEHSLASFASQAFGAPAAHKISRGLICSIIVPGNPTTSYDCRCEYTDQLNWVVYLEGAKKSATITCSAGTVNCAITEQAPAFKVINVDSNSFNIFDDGDYDAVIEAIDIPEDEVYNLAKNGCVRYALVLNNGDRYDFSVVYRYQKSSGNEWVFLTRDWISNDEGVYFDYGIRFFRNSSGEKNIKYYSF